MLKTRIVSRNRRKLLIPGLLILLFGFGVYVHLIWADGPVYAIAELLLGHTVYSTGYSERAYIRIPKGLDVSEVQKRLGEPIGITTNEGRHRYHYTTWGVSDPAGGRDCCFSIRSLIVSNGVVVGKIHYFYLD